MKPLIFITAFVIILGHNIQSTSAQSVHDSLYKLNESRLGFTQNGMAVLGGWAISNMAVSGLGWAVTSGRARHFHEMNVAWGSVNLLISGLGYRSAARKDPNAYTLSETVREQQNFQKLLLFNAGLDLGYMAFGAYLWERGIGTNNRRSVGYGQSIMLQGGFLFVFDILMYTLSRKHSRRLFKIMDSITFNGGVGGFNIRF